MGKIGDFFRSSPKDSVFGRLADADTRLQDARGKVVALKDSVAAKSVATAELKQQALDLHIEHDQLDEQIDGLHELLG